jgi:regulatory protein
VTDSTTPRRRRPAAPDAADQPEPPSALDVAVRYLASRPRSRWEVERRLRRAGIEGTEITAALDRLSELGYLDDAAFARWWGEQRDRHRPRGRRMVEAELRQHGVRSDVIEAYRTEHAAPERAPEDAALPGSEDERARIALARHLRGRPLPDDARAIARIGAFLMRRGFDPDTVRGAIRSAGATDDNSLP